jgi:hypothetical protein
MKRVYYRVCRVFVGPDNFDNVGHRMALRESPTGVTNLSSRFDRRGASELQPREAFLAITAVA